MCCASQRYRFVQYVGFPQMCQRISFNKSKPKRKLRFSVETIKKDISLCLIIINLLFIFIVQCSLFQELIFYFSLNLHRMLAFALIRTCFRLKTLFSSLYFNVRFEPASQHCMIAPDVNLFITLVYFNTTNLVTNGETVLFY